ncbi:MAG: hypothetical protein GWN77_01080, partial [Gammaproteobacteria bacterium]|nr:hypothetical protein [Gammaproteobacteria bacterium]
YFSGGSTSYRADSLGSTVRLFDESLTALTEGGTVAGTDGKSVTLPASTGEARKQLVRVGEQWRDFSAAVETLTAVSTASREDIEQAIEVIRENNTRLLEESNR